MSTPNANSTPSNLQLVFDEEVAISLERLIDSVVMEVTAHRSALQPQQVNESNEDVSGINSLPDDIILEVFGYLKQNQLGQIARVCRKWNVLTKSPVFWKKVNVKIFSSHRSQIIVTKSFVHRLPSCVTSIRLHFMESRNRMVPFDFEELCVKLQEKCPHLQKLILAESKLAISLPSVIDVCSQFLMNVIHLTFHRCIFPFNSSRVQFGGTSKIEDLELSFCTLSLFNEPQFSKMPDLKVLRLYCTNTADSWFEHDITFLSQLHVLNLAFAGFDSRIFTAILNHGHNLKELCLCGADLQDHDLNFDNSAFSHLQTICLRDCDVTCEGVVSLIQSCPSLQNVYAKEDIAESFSVHPFVVANKCKSGIVKAIDSCAKRNFDIWD